MPRVPKLRYPVSRVRRFATWYVCRCDYMGNRTWHYWCRVPGAYRLFRWCEWHQ